MKEQFIEDIKNVKEGEEDWETFDNIIAVIDSLPNCYASGWLSARVSTHNQEDIEELKEDILEWATYEIWLN